MRCRRSLVSNKVKYPGAYLNNRVHDAKPKQKQLRALFLPSCIHFYIVYLPSDQVNVPNASAYVLSVGDVQDDDSKAQIRFNQTPTDHPIVIYGVKKLNLHEVSYNGIKDCPTLETWMYSGETKAHEVGILLTKTWVFAQLAWYLFFLFQFSFDCKEAQEDYEYFKNIHRIKVFLDRVTHIDTVFRHALFENKGARPKKDAFQIYFVDAGTSTTSDSKCFFSNNVTSKCFFYY